MSFPKQSGNLTARVWLLTASWALFAAGIGVCASAQESAERPARASLPEASPTRSDTGGASSAPWPDQVVVLDDVKDIGDLWKKLAGPYILIKKAAGAAAPGASLANAATRDHVIDAVKLEGAVEGVRARVAITIHCSLLSPGPVWVPIRLDDQVVLSAREGKNELALQQGAGKQWEARLEGQGEHLFRVDLLTDVRVDAERRSLSLAIPEAPSTSFSLTLPHEVFDADLGAGEAIGQEKLPDGKGVRLFARTRPRSPLVIGWSEESGAGARVAPLLAARAEMTIDVDSEGISTRSKWVIRCVRGICRSLQFRLDGDEELSPLQLNDQFLASGIEQVKGGSLLNIPLNEPMRQGDARPLVLETRRPLPAGAGKTLVFTGHPLTNAGEQTGMIAVTQGENLWVNLESSQGLRRIDPRDLPSALLGQTRTSIALQFLDQPFRLALGIKDAPPLYKTESTTKLTLDSDLIRNETTLDVQRVRGRLFELEIAVAPELKVVSVGPPELIESTTPPQEPGAGPSTAQPERILKLRLTALGRDQKALSLKLVGRQDAPSSGDVRLGLVTPRGAVSTAAAFEIQGGRDLTIESLDETLFDDPTREPSTTDARPEARLASTAVGTAPAGLRLRSERNPSAIKVRLQRHPLSIAHQTRVAARVDRHGVDLRQESAIQVRYGAVRSLVVRVPPRVSNRWEATAKERLPREDLGPDKDGWRRFRLTFDRPISEAATLTFRYRLPLGKSLDPATPASVQIPWIQVEEGTSSGCSIELSSDADVKVAADDPSWTNMEDDGLDRPDAAAELRRRLIPGAAAPNGLSISAELVESVELPPLIASRALISATLGFENDLRIRAWYALDTHARSFALRLPDGARWIRARVDGRTVEKIQAEDDGASFRFDLPTGTAGRPIVVDVEYQSAAGRVRKAWEAPKLLDGADVLQTYWHVQVPWNAALVGVPAGWADENRWYWDVYVWKRRPFVPIDRLIAWVSELSAPSASVDDPLFDRDDAHAYLFGRAGPPEPLNAWVVSRAWIIVVCSGLVLALGFAVAYLGISERRAWGAAAAAGLLSAMFLHPSVIALFLQSAACGFVLTLLGFMIHRMARREPEATSATRLGASGSGVGYDSSQRSALGVGSDDSTAIRVRAPSTMDYLSPAPAAAASDLDAPRSSSLSGNRANP